MIEAPHADDRPLFIVGCVRSGTTLTRNLLRRVPNFICPEETHFYRWSEAFRTPLGWGPYRNNQVLKAHRELDGVSEETFDGIVESSRGRADLQRAYITAFATAKGITSPYRWFDKTPQNVYGAAIIAQDFPAARFLQLVRNPLNVVASLKLGRQVKSPDIHGACNYWGEAVRIMRTIEAACPDRVLNIRYEDLVADVPMVMTRILTHAGVDAPDGLFHKSDAHPEKNLWRDVLDPDEARIVVDRCGPDAGLLGYDLGADRVI
jgi:hypothetical protein